MLTAITEQLRRLAKLLTHPVRAYFNGHFEMTKAEIRAAAADTAGVSRLSGDVHELSNVVAETSVYQSKLIGDLRDEIARLGAEVEDLRETVAALRHLAAAATTEPSPVGIDGPGS